MNKLFLIFPLVIFSIVAQSAMAGLLTGPRYEYQVNDRGESIMVRTVTTGGHGDGLCGRKEMWSSARHLCMVSTGTKFLYVDTTTGYMEVDLADCGRPGMWATVFQGVLSGVISFVAIKTINDPYVAFGTAGVANSFVGAVSQNRLGKKCLIPAQLADANNFSERVRKEIIREQLVVQQEQVGLENQARQEMGLPLLGVSQQSGPRPGTQQWCDTEANQRYATKGGLSWVQLACAQRGQTFGPTTKDGQRGCGCL